MLHYMNTLPMEDRLPLELSRLYEQFDYKKFCMSKFEEYSFYSDNRDFLSEEGIIAFNNSAGKLMALKPDITLSIVKNARTLPHRNAKYYYNEHVYRIAGGAGDYKEIKQCGIELLGDIGGYATAEIILLALKSLEKIDCDFMLVISHISFVSAILEQAGLSAESKRHIFTFLKQKNAHDLAAYCARQQISQMVCDRLTKLMELRGDYKQLLPALRALADNPAAQNACDELEHIADALGDNPLFSKVRLDLSALNHLDYYNGIILQGYVRNAPAPVLSGGRYDSLAQKIRGDGGAFGFAVYLDGLNLYYPDARTFDCDALILCTQRDACLLRAVDALTQTGLTVRVERELPPGIRAKQIYRFENGTLKEETVC